MACALLLFAGFLALGSWQVQRRAWKLELIERVDQRVHAPAVPVSARAQWPQVSAANDEYRHVQLTGRFLNDRETLVQAVTALGSGFWVLTPLQQADGTVVLVNRGFVPPEARDPATRNTPASVGSTTGAATDSATASTGPATVAGLLRISEPGGGFLRKNDPAAERWYSRDVQAISAARGLTADRVAPFFVDAEAAPGGTAGRTTWPAGGLTVISCPNSHLVYALTWYALAAMVAAAAWYVWRADRREVGRAH